MKIGSHNYFRSLAARWGGLLCDIARMKNLGRAVIWSICLKHTMQKVIFIILCIIAFLLLGTAMIYVGYSIHCFLNRICIRHARRFCGRNGLAVSRARCQPARYQTGAKSEYSLVQLDCLNAQRQRRLILLLVWPFGVRKLLGDEIYPESYDSQWPQKGA